ncbi:MAG TPA: hypothetical protein VLA56_18185, partial [Pseudomonadales bacterium]|nr:hypothetical protein [Pseudomonadales bacterium]
GRRFVHLLDEQRAVLADAGITPVIVGVSTRRHGTIVQPPDALDAGLDAIRLADQVARGDAIGDASEVIPIQSLVARLVAQHAEAHVLVETTTLDIELGEPATTHVRTALEAGAHAVSANKGPVAHAFRALADLAERAGRRFLFEGAVMDGIPIFNLVRETMPGVRVLGFRGVVNSTTNHILTAMEAGEPFAAALERMQAAGVAEADPSLDVDGWDAAAKVAAMANVWMDARITPQDVVREGIGPGTAARAREARARGRRLKLVATAKRRREPFSTEKAPDAFFRVGLEELPADDPLAILDGQANALELETDILGRIVVTQRDGGLEKTAYALFSDLMTVCREKGAGSLFR